MVSQVDRLLREEFHLPDGLADTATWGDMRQRFPQLQSPRFIGDGEPFVRILDPAAGTGVFLVEVIDRVHTTLRDKWTREAKSPEQIRELWNAYVPRHLLPRLLGVELLLPASVLATLQIADKLAATGYEFAAPGRIGIYLADTLAGPARPRMPCGLPDDWLQEIQQSFQVRYEIPVTAVVGNPPFSAISQNRSRWIDALLKGQGSDASGRGYYEVDGLPLGERKLWLQDDYVKFMRYAQWRIECAGSGILGLVTNHGYLDNASFRGMRQRLIQDFSRVTILDLHGNRNKGETAAGGSPDENVFGVDSGVAVGLFRSPPERGDPDLRYGELWGTREAKLRDLARDALPRLQRASSRRVRIISSCLAQRRIASCMIAPFASPMPCRFSRLRRSRPAIVSSSPSSNRNCWTACGRFAIRGFRTRRFATGSSAGEVRPVIVPGTHGAGNCRPLGTAWRRIRSGTATFEPVSTGLSIADSSTGRTG